MKTNLSDVRYEVEESSEAAHYLHHDKTYYFCALSCKNQFERYPEEDLENSAGPDKNQNSHSSPVNLTESFPASLDKLELPISGMGCASCVNRIRATLRKVPGVIAANINFATEKTAVEYILGQVTTIDIAKTIEAVGYKILEIAEISDK